MVAPGETAAIVTASVLSEQQHPRRFSNSIQSGINPTNHIHRDSSDGKKEGVRSQDFNAVSNGAVRNQSFG